jgi:membrane-bound metal-dependent hydrolase YbcI (DUF457 family)
MDIVTHAIVGAVTGWPAGHPVAGALVAITPDLTLGLKRHHLPPVSYVLLHSWVGLLAALVVAVAFKADWVFGCYLSHVILDVLTHGKEWTPRLMYPRDSLFHFEEWEFFNDTWKFGLGAAGAWCAGTLTNWYIFS